MICHICETETEFSCEVCHNPVCEDCCVAMTYHNQIDYPLCHDCETSRENAYHAENEREREQEEQLRLKKEKTASTRKTNYFKPENIEKRRLKKIERKRLKTELLKSQLEATYRIAGEVFGINR